MQPVATSGRLERLADRRRVCRRAARRAGRGAGRARPAPASSSVSLADRRLEQAEQAGDLLVGARPVLAAERVQGQDRDTASDRVAQEPADGLDAGRVAVELGQVVLACPAPVAVHDDRDVAGQLLGREEGRLAVRDGRARRSASGSATGACAAGGASVGRARCARATRPRGPPVPWPRPAGRPRRCGGRSSSGACPAGGATRPFRSRRRAPPS